MDFRFILNTKYNNSEVLCFFRKNKSYAMVYRQLVLKFSKTYLKVEAPDTISEYKGQANHYIDLHKYNLKDFTNEDLTIFNQIISIVDIRRQERLFRNCLDYYSAYNLLINCTKYFIELFKNSNYKVIVTQIVDNYVMDIMVKVANYYGIQVIGIVKFFFPGYVRITTYGEHNLLRDVSSDEVDILYTKLLNKEKTIFNISRLEVLKENLRQYVTYKGKYLIHYLLFHKILGKLEYDYVSTLAQEYPKKVKNFFIRKYFEKDLSKLKLLNKTKVAYIPLHFYPEATVEYWVDNPTTSPYYPSLYETVLKLTNNGYSVVLKEHPAFYLKRKKSIYRTLKSINNVYLINPFVPTYEVINFVDYVVVWTGTSGIEALIQGKKVITVSENYYSNGELENVDRIEYATSFTEEQKRRLLKRILDNCLPLST